MLNNKSKKYLITLITILITSFILVSCNEKIKDKYEILGIDAKPIYLEKASIAGDPLYIYEIKDYGDLTLTNIDDDFKQYMNTPIISFVKIIEDESNALETKIDRDKLAEDISSILNNKNNLYKYINNDKRGIDTMILYDVTSNNGYIIEIDSYFRFKKSK
ncbi:hypothetical protein ACKA01_05575 [Helcococcus kunzii]|uniref:hypothetical protein n=1 Tax=Helcococcus kunzii TaxID=40091 RepID=UPI001BAF62FE|nr:hypothetical protein [Helcococcus kunzii]MCT1796757.1 hypothetical protein [Helcococcus kunzii]MCT1988855.1 hypothetical protein [Helcococcus kunzii]QUY64500.1 hypothetical protein GUI37_02865 [Helcococcus kunzii]QZO76913.1 hypothetical protein HIF96_02525 [Helcococcus kunzii]